MTTIFWFLVGCWVYMLPTVVASNREIDDTALMVIFGLNLVLGWTLIMRIIVLLVAIVVPPKAARAA